MVSIGVTGHIRLTPATGRLVHAAVEQALRRFPVVHGITCLADGSDRIFARAVLARGGTYEVVLPVPADDPDGGDVPRHLLRPATSITRISEPGPAEVTYEAASRVLVERADLLLAIWDGHPDSGRGGTAQTVEWARSRGLDVMRVWPAGARRLSALLPVG